MDKLTKNDSLPKDFLSLPVLPEVNASLAEREIAEKAIEEIYRFFESTK